MADLNPEFVARVGKIALALDSLDYFQLLRVDSGADTAQIRAGYHQQARAFHPDRFQHTQNAELLAQVIAISKRLTEAYTVLRDEEKRQRYRDALAKGERGKNLRFTEQDERQIQEDQRGPQAQSAAGRPMLAQALELQQAGNFKEAAKSLRMALLYEKDNQGLKDLLARIEAQAAGK